MNISAWAIRKPLPVMLLFLVLTALGLASYNTIPVTYFPAINIPTVGVTIEQSSAAPGQMEVQVTKLVEDSIAALSDIREIKSNISQGRSVTTVEFEIGVPVDRAVADVKDAVTKIRDRLPAGIDEPLIERIDPENPAVVTYSVKNGSMSAAELSYFVEDVVVRKLRGIAGVGRVELAGTVNREIQIKLDREHLRGLGLTSTAVSDQIAASQFDLPAGRSELDAQDKTLATRSAVTSLEALQSIRVTTPQGPMVAISDLGGVHDTIARREDYALLNGEPAVAFTIYKAIGSGDVEVAEKVAAALGEIAKVHGETAFQIVDDSVTLTSANFHSARDALVEGAILAIIVVFLFLRDWRATLIAAISLPLSIIPTFWVIELAGFSLNMLSLLAITLVTGILVDDSIVEIENIVRHRNLGKTAFQAALDASDEIGLAVIAISAAIIAVFAPVGLMGGEVGQYFRQFGLTIAIAVFFSLLVARLVTPILAAYLLKSSGKPHAEGSLMTFYRRIVALAVAWRWTTAGLALALFIASVALAARLPTEFVPATDTGRITISVELPPGSTLADSEVAAKQITERLNALEDVKTVFARAGAGSEGIRDIRKLMIVVTVGDRNHRTLSISELENRISQQLHAVPDLRFELINDRGGRAISFAVLSANGEEASKAAAAILDEMRAAGIYVNPTSSEASRQPELRIAVIPERAADLGITASEVAAAIRVATSGDADAKLPNFNDQGRLIPIRTIIDEARLDGVEALRQMQVAIPSRGLVPLEAVARIDEEDSVSIIQRMNRQRRVELGADLQPGITQGEGMAALKELSSAKALPAAVELIATGDSDNMDSVFTSFSFAMIAGLSLVMIVLILLLGSPLTPLTIITPLPLAISGVIGSLLVMDYPVSLPVVIGILMLMGIVVKNSILLVDFAVELERSGLPRVEATIEACAERLRPIVMTTLAMVAGMVPAALGHQIGGEFRAPMAVAVIGGLLASTALSLLVVAVIHILVSELNDRLKHLARHLIDVETRVPRNVVTPPRRL